MLPVLKRSTLPGYLHGEEEKKFGQLLTSISGELLSHPEKNLRTHLSGVWQHCRQLQEAFSIPADKLKLELIALTHDIGKANIQFQEYLQGKGNGTPHALPSAWFTLLFARECGMPWEEAIWCAEVVRRHHTHLVDENSLWADWFPQNADHLRVIQQMRNLLPMLPYRFSVNDLSSFKDMFFDLEETMSLERWLETRMMYSTLITADRLDAIGISELNNERNVPKFKTPKYHSSSSEINKWRSETQEECFQNALTVINKPGAFTLTLPTGSGKTLLAFRIAHALMKRLQLKSIVYALPFISIVEQTANVACEIFEEDQVQEDHSLVLYEGTPATKTQIEDEGEKWDRMTQVFRYWHKPIVLTTMAHLWEALFEPRANKTMNFHRLSRAVVILDEPQTIPTTYWAGFGELLAYLSDTLQSVFLLMTATQPQIIERQNEKTEISPRSYNLPKKRHSYEMFHLDTSHPISKILDLVKERELFKRKAGLVVCNTRRSALECFNQLYENRGVWVSNNIQWFFLSTWMTPHHRRAVLAKLKECEKNRQDRILVSTQVIEAGVDLDFDWVIRDFGPLDSIIQVAGRCNRHLHNLEYGKVMVIRLHEEKENRCLEFSKMVYDSVIIDATLRVLKGKTHFDENEMSQIIAAYYDDLKSRKTQHGFLQELKMGKWENAIPLYQQKRMPEVGVIIEENNEVITMLHYLKETKWGLENLDEKKRTTKTLMQHVIQIPSKYLEMMKIGSSQIVQDEAALEPALGENMYFFGKCLIGTEENQYYHPLKGFVPPIDDQTALIF